jgi:hypothetical protein
MLVPNGSPGADRTRPGSRRVGLVALALAVVVLVALPSVALGSGAPVSAPSGNRPTLGGSPTSISSTSSMALVGSSPSARHVDAAAVYREFRSESSPPGNVSTPKATPTADRPFLRADRGSGSPSAADGWLSGTVLDSVYGTGLAGANVTPSSANGTCLPCAGTTNSTGFFRVAAAPGPTELSFEDTGYLPNVTFATVVSGSVVSVGTVLLVHEATVEGTVVADLPGLPALANYSVSSNSRDGHVYGPTSVLTAPNGSFVLPVDPFAVEVEVQPAMPTTSPFLPNETYADASPWQVVNLGTIRLEGGVTANASVVDSVTGLPVRNATGVWCSYRIQNTCLPGGPGSGSIRVATVAGPGFLVVAAPGYVSNSTFVPDIPTGTAGPVRLPTVHLVPDGFVELTVNFTGGTPNSTWAPSGGGFNFTVAACSLSGTTNAFVGSISPLLPQGFPSGCLFTPAVLGETVLVAAPPLRDVVYILQNYPAPGGIPIAGHPIPSTSYEYVNVTWANVTPDEVAFAGTVGLLAGTYLSGSVTVAGTYRAVAANANVSIQVCSTVRALVCENGVTTGPYGQSGAVPAGCSTAGWTFCAPSPPGPVRVTIGWGPAANGTWVDVPYTCCSQQGHPTDIGTFGLLADVGAVHGTIGIVGEPSGAAPPGGWVGEVEACTAVSDPVGCFATTVPTLPGGGSAFFVPAALGWDQITVLASGFRTNRTWIDVTANNSTGEIELTPYAEVGGRIVSATTGAPVLEASLTACNVATQVCDPLGVEDDSNGTFNASFPAFPYPGGTFQIEVSASGYDPESTFANMSAGTLTVLPPIRLPPVGVAGGVPVRPGAQGAGSSTPTTGSWVTGRLVDSHSGLGLGAAGIDVCQLLSSGGCRITPTESTSGGEFNLSTVHGAYEIWFNSTDYPSDLVYLNATTAGTVDLGNIEMTPYPRLTGRVDIDPWASLAPSLGEGVDQAIVEVCAGAECGAIGATNSAGFFNVSAPEGTADRVLVEGGGPGTWGGQGLGGFSLVQTNVNVPPSGAVLASTGPGGAVLLPILGGFVGVANETGGGPARPSMFDAYGATGSLIGASLDGITGSGGGFAAFLPAGDANTTLRAAAIGLVPAGVTIPNVTVAAGIVEPAPGLTATRFGFVTAKIVDTGTGAPLGEIPLTVSATGSYTGLLGGNDISNGSGDINVSAPPGLDDLGINSTAYGIWSGTTDVPVGALAAFGTVSLTALADGGITIVRTEQVNSLSGPIVPGVFDNATDRPVPGAGIVESSLAVHVGPVNDSDLGQFLIAVTPDDGANITISAAGFDPLTVPENLTTGETLVLQPVNATAGGILTGTVVSEPGNVTVPYATVSACPVARPTCETTVVTNATGVFWVGVPSGLDQVSVESNAYLTNLTRIVDVIPDSFVELGHVPVFGFGTVRGIVLGLPSGRVLPYVNVSLCSEFSPPAGCLPDETVTTDANGSFSIESPPGVYFVDSAPPGYNATRFELVLGPGENLDLGVVVVQAYGVEIGTVVTPTGAPVPNATVFTCAAYSGGSCAGPATTDADGTFHLVAPPGANDLTVSAPGYLDADVRATVPSGESVVLAPVVLTPQPPDIVESVTGFVTDSRSGDPLAGAFVDAFEAGARVGQTQTRGNGFYDLAVRWGSATVFVGTPGFRSENVTLLVHANVTGLNFTLTTMLYDVRGVAFDGGSGTVLGGVSIAENGTTLGTTAADGTFDLLLPNGTADLVGTHAPVGAVDYGAIRFAVLVSGGPVVHDLTIPRTVVPLSGDVVDAATGEPIPSATVTVWTAGGAPLSTAATGSVGSFAFGVAPGRYNVSVVAPGYLAANVSVSTGAGGTHTTVALTVGASGGTSGSSLLAGVEVGAAAAVVAVLASAAILWRRSRRPPEGERYYPPGEPVELGDDVVT